MNFQKSNTNFVKFDYPIIKGFIVFLILSVITQTIAYQSYVITKSEEKSKTIKVADEKSNKLISELYKNLFITKSLAYIVQNYGVPNDFDSVARNLFPDNHSVDALELTNNGVITHVYPYQENEVVIGYDIFKDPLHKIEAYKAINKKELYFEGPINLKQGGMAVVGRYPFFDKKTERFVGFSVVIIKLKTLLNLADITNKEDNDFIYALSKYNPVTKREEFFLSEEKDFKYQDHPVVDIPIGEWKLYVVPKKTLTIFSNLPLILLGFMLSVISGLLTWFVAKQPRKLSKLVNQKVRELKINEDLLIETQKLAKIGSWEIDFASQLFKASEMFKFIFEVPDDFEFDRESLVSFCEDFESKTILKRALDGAYTSNSFDVVVKIKTPNIQKKWLRIKGEPETDANNLIRIFGSVQDITSETITNFKNELLSKQIKEIGGAIPGVIYQLKLNQDKELSFTYLSESARLFLNLKPSEVYINPNKLLDLIAKDDQKPFYDSLYKSAADLNEHVSIFKIILNEEDIWLSANAKPSKAYNGDIIWNGTLIDITPIRNAEGEMSYLAGLLANIKDSIISTDENFVIKSWNKGAELVYGWEASEVIGKKFQTVMKTRYFNSDRKILREEFFNTGVFNGEVVQYTKDGSEVEILMNSVLLKDKNGNLTGSVTVNRSIVAIKKSEKESIYKTNLLSTINIINNELLQKGDWFLAFHQSFSIMGKTIGASRIYYYQNGINENGEKVAYQMIEWNENDHSITLKDYKVISLEFVNAAITKINEDSYFTAVYSQIDDDNLKQLFNRKSIKSLLMFPLIVDEKHYGYLCFEDLYQERVWSLDDISFVKTISNNLSTAIEKAEYVKKIKQAYDDKNIILESIGDAFFAIDVFWKVNYWNKIAECLFKIDKKDVLGKVIWGNIFKDDDPIFYPQFIEATKTGKSVHFDAYYEKQDIWMEVSAYPSEVGLSIYLKDITQRIRYVEAIQKQNQNLKEISWLQSHVIRAPLARLMGLVNIRESIDPKEMSEKEFFDLLMLTANELDDVIKDITNKTQYNSLN